MFRFSSTKNRFVIVYCFRLCRFILRPARFVCTIWTRASCNSERGKKENKWTKICYCFKCLRRSSVQFHRDAKEHFYDRAFERMIRFFFYSSSLSQNINTTDIRHPIERKWLVMHTHKEQLVFFLKNKHLNSWTCCFVFEIEFRKKMHSLARSFAYFK